MIQNLATIRLIHFVDDWNENQQKKRNEKKNPNDIHHNIQFSYSSNQL